MQRVACRCPQFAIVVVGTLHCVRKLAKPSLAFNTCYQNMACALTPGHRTDKSQMVDIVGDVASSAHRGEIAMRGRACDTWLITDGRPVTAPPAFVPSPIATVNAPTHGGRDRARSVRDPNTRRDVPRHRGWRPRATEARVTAIAQIGVSTRLARPDDQSIWHGR